MAKRNLTFVVFVTLFLLISCNSSQKENKEVEITEEKAIVLRDLDDIKKEGALNVLTTYSSTSYFLYRGQPMGYEYELLKRFAEHLGVKLNMVVANDIETMYNELSEGKIDLIAHGITITRKRKEVVNFSEYLYLTKQVLVQKKPDNWRKLRWQAIEDALRKAEDKLKNINA